MIRLLPESEGSVIGIEVAGKISMEQEKQWMEKFDQLMAEHSNINVLILLSGKINVGVDVAYEDLKWTFKHLKNIDKLAFVSNSKVLGWLVAIDSPFGKLAGVDEKHFETDQLQEAWGWVKDK